MKETNRKGKIIVKWIKEGLINIKQEISRIEKKIGKKLDAFEERDWDKISKEEKLSNYFLMDYAKNLNMKEISVHQRLTFEFIVSHMNELDLDAVLENKKVKLSENERLKIEELKKIINFY